MNDKPLGARVFQFLLRVLLRPLFRVRVTGNPEVFRNPRTLIVANHLRQRRSDGLTRSILAVPVRTAEHSAEAIVQRRTAVL